MGSLRKFILAGFGGQLAPVVLGLVAMPIYLRILGVESYGLIGFYLSLQVALSLLDLGLSPTLSRELARHKHSGSAPDASRDLVRTFEWLYWPVGAGIAVIVLVTSDIVAGHWLKPVSLSVDATANSIALMGLATAAQWPVTLYQGGLRGIERHVELNAVGIGAALLRTIGSIILLVYVSPTLHAFLAWQIVVAAVHTTVLRSLTWRLLPASKRLPAFKWEVLVQLRNFSLGLTGIAALSVLLMQSDRMILSTLLPLDDFGYYVVAATIATALSSMVGPFFFALYPRFSGLVGAEKQDELIELYHQGNQWLTVFVAASAAVIAFFSTDLLLLWTGNPTIAANSAPILSILVVGTALNGLVHLPYALQLAHGWTRLALLQNAIAVVFIVPATWWLAQRYGGTGAAIAWTALNLGYLFISVPIMHRRLLPGELAHWYLRDLLPPISAAALMALLMSHLFRPLPDGLPGLALLAFISAATLTVSGLGARAVRDVIMQSLRRPGV